MTDIYLVYERLDNTPPDYLCGLFFDVESARKAVLDHIGSKKYTVEHDDFDLEIYDIDDERGGYGIYIDLNEKPFGKIF